MRSGPRRRGWLHRQPPAGCGPRPNSLGARLRGVQGTGKTTAAGKLALHLKKKGLKVLMVATDVYRPGGF